MKLYIYLDINQIFLNTVSTILKITFFFETKGSKINSQVWLALEALLKSSFTKSLNYCLVLSYKTRFKKKK